MTLTQPKASNGEEVPSSQEAGILKNGWRWLQQRLADAPGWFIGLLLGLIALGFDLYRLGTPSIWFDEAFSVELARLPMPQLWHIISGPEPNMELYYIFLHYWLQLTTLLGLHPTEFVVRFPSAVFAACSTIVVFMVGRRFLGTFVGALAAALYLLDNLQLVYAQQTRSYSLQLLLLCLAWYALLTAFTRDSQQKRWWIYYVITSVLAIYTHLFSVLVLGAQCVAVAGLFFFPNVWRPRVRRQSVAFVGCVVIISVLSIPMILVSRQGAMTGWLSVPHLGQVVYLLQMLGGYTNLYILVLAVCGVTVVLVATLSWWIHEISSRAVTENLHPVLAIPSSLRNALPVLWGLLCWLLIPSIVSYIVSQGTVRLFSVRYLVVIVPPLFLLVSSVLLIVRHWRILQVAVALILVLLALRAAPYYYKSAQVEDWNTAVHWLEQHYQPGDGLVCYDNTIRGPVKQGCQISVEYYLHAYPGPAAFTPDTPGAFSWESYSAPHPEDALDPTLLRAFGDKHAQMFFIVGRVRDDAAAQRVQATEQWLDHHYRFVNQITTRTVTIRLYDTGMVTGREKR